MDKTCVDPTAKLAYELWLRRGSPEGSPEEDWFEAERFLHADRTTSGSRETSTPLKTSVTRRSKIVKKYKTKVADT